jgi:prepilin-type N-terminal cleavage/methylation domain-containing protein
MFCCGEILKYLGRDRQLGGDLYECSKCLHRWSKGPSLDGGGIHWFEYDSEGELIWRKPRRQVDMAKKVKRIAKGFTVAELLIVIAIAGILIWIIIPNINREKPKPEPPSDVPPHLRELFTVTPITSEVK